MQELWHIKETSDVFVSCAVFHALNVYISLIVCYRDRWKQQQQKRMQKFMGCKFTWTIMYYCWCVSSHSLKVDNASIHVLLELSLYHHVLGD